MNRRQSLLQVEEIMEEFGFDQGEKWKYDPYHIISNKRGEISYAPYIHESNPKLEKMESQETWSGIKMQQIIYVQTPIVREKILKRNT